MKGKKSFWLQTVKQMNTGAIVCGVGFLLYIALSALNWELPADIVAIAFGLASLYVFLSALDGRSRDKESVSYNLMWGTGALTILLLGLAVLTIKARLGM